jgi:hypothetical protein
MAAADLLGRVAGDTVKRVSNVEAVNTALCDGLVEGRMDVMACELAVKVMACVINCLSLAYEGNVKRFW